MSTDRQHPKWTDIEHLPEWDEEFYHIYSACKHGKRVMLKTLRPEIKDTPEGRAMIEKEFEVRYNLAHPNIVMINDFEDVPGIGLCIVTDDVYGTPLAALIRDNKVTPRHIAQLCDRLPHAIDYIQENHIVHPAISADNIIFTDKIGNMKMIDVGFEQRPSLTQQSVNDDIAAYGNLLKQALDACPYDVADARRLHNVAERALRGGYSSVNALRKSLDNMSHDRFYLLVIAFLAVMIAVIIWFTYNPMAGN